MVEAGDTTDQETRILRILEQNPGIHISKIAEILGLLITQVEQILIRLERLGRISSVDVDGVKQYYIECGAVGSSDRRSVETRQQIYALIQKNPGLHMTKIAEMLDMRVTLADYHLNYLEKHGDIVGVKKNEYFKRYYVKGDQLGVQERELLSILRRDVPLRIVLLLVKHRQLRHRDLLNKLDIASSTLSYHLNTLVEHRIIELYSFGDERGYRLCDRKEVIRIVLKYEFDVVVDGVRDAFEGLSY
jgi:predicted transcriptional regulator